MRIVKLGGSLMQDPAFLKHSLNTLAKQSKDKIVIVPGGGDFANQIRSLQKQWNFNQEIAHQMAILSMQQMALLFNSISPFLSIANTVSKIQQTLTHHSVVIWSPEIQELNASKIKASWDISSDSLSAWLAEQLNAKQLIVVKSAKIPTKTNFVLMQKQGLLDKAFHQFTENASYKVNIINKHSFNEYFPL